MMLEKTLIQMAEKILHLDEASLIGLWDKYRQRMEQVDVSRDWERSVIVFFMINAVRAKNQILNERILSLQDKKPEATLKPPKQKPNLRLVKPYS
jgi:hypothetical protein